MRRFACRSRNVTLSREPQLGPGRHLVALDQRVDLVDPLALGDCIHDDALGGARSCAKIDDTKRSRSPVDQKTERHRVVVDENLVPIGGGICVAFRSSYPPRGMKSATPPASCWRARPVLLVPRMLPGTAQLQN